MRHLEETHEHIGEDGIKIDLDDNGDGDEDDGNPFGGQVFRLKSENEHQREEQSNNRHRMENRQKFLFKPFISVILQQSRACDETRCQRNHDEYNDGCD